MCGFAGVLLGSAGERSFETETALEAMSLILSHRGPDDHGLQWVGPCGLAHRRLSVIDLSAAGHQPMPSEDGRVWIAYNGEVYNFNELRREFGLDREFRFRSRTDTEVLLFLYEKLGRGFLEHLNGMFSLAIWDSRRDTLLLARDPFGIKPLFYMEHNGGFWFASEIKSLLQAPAFVREPDHEALYHYLAFNYVPGTLTPFKGVCELSPGTAIEVRPGCGVTARWDHFEYGSETDHSLDQETAVEETLRLLRESVGRQLISDVPVGVMLSGGMDSSALTALMAQVRGGSAFHTFSLSFREPSFDESPYARMVAEDTGTIHHEIMVTPGKVEALLPGYLAHIDEPYADGSAIPTWLLAAEAAPLVTVLLSGEGGDELFAGYDTHAAMKARMIYRRLVPGFVRRGVVAPIVNRLPVSHSKLSFEFKAKRFTTGSELGVPESHFAWRAVLTGDERLRVLPGAHRGRQPSETFFTSVYNACSGETPLARILRIDTASHLPNDLMIKNDRMTMAHSVEARVPFTDTGLYRFTASVPDGIRMPGLRPKNLLRKAMKGILPSRVRAKKKVGLEMPYSGWFRNEMKDFAHDSLFSSSILESGVLARAALEELWNHHQEGRRDNGRALWGLLNLSMWYDLYISTDHYRSFVLPGRSRLRGE